MASPSTYAIPSRYRSWPGASASSAHRKISHTTSAVANVLMAYTSASTALNQWLSVAANASAPITPPA